MPALEDYLCHSLCCGVSSKMVWRNMQREEKQLWGEKKVLGENDRTATVRCFTHRLVLKAARRDHSLGKVQNICTDVCRHRGQVQNMETVTSMFLWKRRTLRDENEERCRTHAGISWRLWCQCLFSICCRQQKENMGFVCGNHRKNNLFRKTYLEKSLSTSYSYFIHVSLYTKNSRKARSAMALNAMRDTADETVGHVVLLFYPEKTKQNKAVGGMAHLFLPRPRSPRSSQTLWGRRPAPSPSSRLSCATDASSLRWGLSSTDRCQNQDSPLGLYWFYYGKKHTFTKPII